MATIIDGVKTLQIRNAKNGDFDLNLEGCDCAYLESLIYNAYPSESETGNPIYFDDGADSVPVKELIVNLEPKQSGTGDPSPTNVRPITGYDGVTVKRTGKNLIPNLKIQDTSTRVRLGESSLGNGVFYKAGTYKISVGLATAQTVGIYWRTSKNGESGPVNNSDTIVLTEDVNVVIWLYLSSGISVDDVTWFQVEQGSTATSYEPYQGQEYSITFPSSVDTVYGGRLNVTTGELTVDRGFIASYNGETLPSTWISDRDVYASGTTPTTGAQVVYELATPTTVQLTPTEVTTLLGNNTITSDGSMNLQYRADISKVIEKLTNAIISLGGNV